MQFVSFEQFVSMPKHGYIYFFSMDESCGLCKQCQIELEKNNIPKLIKVTTENESDFLSVGVKAVPCLRVYDTEDKVLREWHGVLYETQIKELMQYLS